MRGVPLVIVTTGVPPLPLSVLKPVWVETQHSVNGIPSAKVVLTAEGDTTTVLNSCEEDVSLCKAGRPISISIRKGDEDGCVFSGVVVTQTLRLSPGGVELTLMLRHDLQKLVNTHRSQVFMEQDETAVVAKLMSDQKIPLLEIRGMNTVHDQLVQFRCSDWHFVRCRLNANGVWLFPAPTGVRIGPPKLGATPDHTLKQRASIVGVDTLATEGSWSFSEQYQPSRLTVEAWNDQAQIADTMLAAPTALGVRAFNSAVGERLNTSTWEFNHSTPLGISQTVALATGLLMNLQAAAAVGEFAVSGATHYQLGETLALDGFGLSFDGVGIITSIKHRVNKEEGWRTDLSLGDNDVNQDMSSIPAATGLHIGVVATFKEDMSGMNRLRIRMPVLGDSNHELWARLSSPYASQMSGFCFYPEDGDEVVVGFFENDPCFPVILGSMHNPVNRAPIAPSLKNNVKSLMVDAGGESLQVSFDTLMHSATISALDHNLTLHEGATLESKEVVKIKATEVSIDGKETTLSGKSAVNIRGSTIDLSH